jgi:lysophospholipase L1-like esterase
MNLRHSPIPRIAMAIVGLSVCGCSKSGLGESPTAPSMGSKIIFSAIGASDANGVGSSVQCLPFTDCPAGMGYVQVASRQLQAQGFSVSLTNFGIPTAVIGRGFESLAVQYGRTIAGNLIDHEMPFVPKDTTVTTIFAGVNEVNTITAALGAGAGTSNPNAYIDDQVRSFGADYTTLIEGIRSRAAQSRIVVLNVPNVGAMPYQAGAPLAQKQASQRAAVAMSRTVVNRLASNSVFIIDTMCDPRSYQPGLFSGDGLHPNDAGYANIAADVVRAITSPSYPAPQDSCSSMTLIP